MNPVGGVISVLAVSRSRDVTAHMDDEGVLADEDGELFLNAAHQRANRRRTSLRRDHRVSLRRHARDPWRPMAVARVGVRLWGW